MYRRIFAIGAALMSEAILAQATTSQSVRDIYNISVTKRSGISCQVVGKFTDDQLAKRVKDFQDKGQKVLQCPSENWLRVGDSYSSWTAFIGSHGKKLCTDLEAELVENMYEGNRDDMILFLRDKIDGLHKDTQVAKYLSERLTCNAAHDSAFLEKITTEKKSKELDRRAKKLSGNGNKKPDLDKLRQTLQQHKSIKAINQFCENLKSPLKEIDQLAYGSCNGEDSCIEASKAKILQSRETIISEMEKLSAILQEKKPLTADICCVLKPNEFVLHTNQSRSQTVCAVKPEQYPAQVAH